MIPGTAIPTTRLAVDDSVQPVKPTQAVADILSEFRPGERLVAEIQSQLPNGTYRALIAQRDVTLALPFSAKPGDALELQVVDTDGRLTLAVVNRQEDAATEKPSVTTTLSRTAQLIGSLSPPPGEEGTVPPAALNGNRPIAAAPPQQGADLTPLLQKALSQSGLFYESHQAAWIAGRMTPADLRREPQANVTAAEARPPAVAPTADPAAEAANRATAATDARAAVAPPSAESIGRGAMTPPPLPPELAPLVQQQLNALATNLFAWQGLAWPGQRIDWEIVDGDAQRGQSGDADEAPRWQTTLRLALPSLGAVDAVIGLRGGEVELSLLTRSEASRQTLVAGGDSLRRQFEAAGLKLATLGVTATGDAA